MRKYVTEPLYRHPEVTVLNPHRLLQYNLHECENRALDILSYGESQRLHVHMDRFPWNDLEELFGEHLQTALRLSMEKTKHAIEAKEAYIPNIFDKYIFHHRIDFLS